MDFIQALAEFGTACDTLASLYSTNADEALVRHAKTVRHQKRQQVIDCWLADLGAANTAGAIRALA